MVENKKTHPNEDTPRPRHGAFEWLGPRRGRKTPWSDAVAFVLVCAVEFPFARSTTWNSGWHLAVAAVATLVLFAILNTLICLTTDWWRVRTADPASS